MAGVSFGSSPDVTVVGGTTPQANGTNTDGVATSSTGAVPTADFMYVFNGTTWDRVREGAALGSLMVNNPTAANLFATVIQGTSPWVVSGNVGVAGPVTVVETGQPTPTTSLAAQSAVQNGTVQDDGGMRAHHTLVVTTSAGVSAGTVVLQLSQDNVNWFTGVTISTSTANNVYAVDVTGAFRYSRAAITTSITGGTITATIASV